MANFRQPIIRAYGKKLSRGHQQEQQRPFEVKAISDPSSIVPTSVKRKSDIDRSSNKNFDIFSDEFSEDDGFDTGIELPSRKFSKNNLEKVRKAKTAFDSKAKQQLKRTLESNQEHEKRKAKKLSKLKEKEKVIEEGAKKGYATQFKEDDLKKIMNNAFLQDMRDILHGKKSSCNYDAAKSYAENSAAPFISHRELIMNNRVPDMGYYGFKGREVIGACLLALQPEIKSLQEKQNNEWMLKYDDSLLLEMVLYEEAMTYIIMKEKSVDQVEAKKILKESTLYGDTYFTS